MSTKPARTNLLEQFTQCYNSSLHASIRPEFVVGVAGAPVVRLVRALVPGRLRPGPDGGPDRLRGRGLARQFSGADSAMVRRGFLGPDHVHDADDHDHR